MITPPWWLPAWFLDRVVDQQVSDLQVDNARLRDQRDEALRAVKTAQLAADTRVELANSRAREYMHANDILRRHIVTQAGQLSTMEARMTSAENAAALEAEKNTELLSLVGRLVAEHQSVLNQLHAAHANAEAEPERVKNAVQAAITEDTLRDVERTQGLIEEIKALLPGVPAVPVPAPGEAAEEVAVPDQVDPAPVDPVAEPAPSLDEDMNGGVGIQEGADTRTEDTSSNPS